MIELEPTRFNFGGQPVVYSSENKMAKTVIGQPFMTAGRILGWPKGFGMPGIGLNYAIVSLLKRTKCKLIVHILQEGKDYFFDNDKVVYFIKTQNTQYKAGSKPVHVIPWSLCKPSIR